jgi:putative flippase GtrA
MQPKPAARLQALWAGKSFRQLSLFVLVGALNTLFGYGCYALLLWLGLHYGMATLLGTILGVLFNFRTTGRLVFQNHDNRLLGRFILVYVVGYGANVAGLWALQKIGFDAYKGGALLLAPSALLTILLQMRYVFVDPKKKNSLYNGDSDSVSN